MDHHLYKSIYTGAYLGSILYTSCIHMYIWTEYIYIARPRLGRKLCDKSDPGLNLETALAHTFLDPSWYYA